MPVEITCAWVRAEKGIGARIVLGMVCARAVRTDSGAGGRQVNGQKDSGCRILVGFEGASFDLPFSEFVPTFHYSFAAKSSQYYRIPLMN